MTRHSISKKRYLEVGQVFHWATKEHYQLMFTGKAGRHSRTEKILPRLVKEKKLVARVYDNRLIYSVPRKCQTTKSRTFPFIEHGLACTECLVRIWLSRTEGEIIAEKYFKNFGIVPEWGIRYPNKLLLLMEYSTEDNFNRYALVKGKIERYLNNVERISETFNCHSATVLFVFDVQRERVEKFVRDNYPIGEPFFFSDNRAFLLVPPGKQLTAPIYIWEDGQAYPLARNN